MASCTEQGYRGLRLPFPGHHGKAWQLCLWGWDGRETPPQCINNQERLGLGSVDPTYQDFTVPLSTGMWGECSLSDEGSKRPPALNTSAKD